MRNSGVYTLLSLSASWSWAVPMPLLWMMCKPAGVQRRPGGGGEPLWYRDAAAPAPAGGVGIVGAERLSGSCAPHLLSLLFTFLAPQSALRPATSAAAPGHSWPHPVRTCLLSSHLMSQRLLDTENPILPESDFPWASAAHTLLFYPPRW